VPDAVVVYRIFGLSLDALFALFRVIVTAAIIILTLRIPFKRKYHWAFLAWNFAFLWGTSFAFLAQASTDAATALGWYHPMTFLGQSAPQVLLAYQFVIYFISSKPSRWQKYLLIGGYAWTAAVVWVPLLLGDQSFFVTTLKLTAFGWTLGPGTSAPYLVPYGIDYYFTAMVVVIFYLLVRHYRSEKSPLKRGQTKYVIVGMFFIFVGTYQHYISSNLGLQNIPVFQNLISAPGDLAALFGLRRKGFYSVTPTAETAAAVPVVYPLEEGHSYLAHDTKTSFEAFTSLVKNGHEGLSITRIFPDQIRKDYGIQTTPIRWLAEVKGQDAIPPGDLLGLSLTVKDFFEKAKKPVVMLHGIEYLTTINGFTPILRLIQGLCEENATRNGILILPVLPETLNRQDEALLASETTPMPMPAN